MEPQKNKDKDPKDNQNYKFIRGITTWLLVFLGFIWLVSLFSNGVTGMMEKLSYNEFYAILENNVNQPVIAQVKMTDNLLQGTFTSSRENKRFYVYIPADDRELIPLLKSNVSDFEIEPPKTMWTNILFSLAPMLLFILFLWYFAYRGSQFGGKVWSFGKAKSHLIEKGKTPKVTFRDVAGIDEAKEELNEVIEFLKDPKRFERLGGRIPRGVMLVGPPGCGKTLLAKAVAGEADVPFFNISGSDFVELFVGVGASRVRDLFEQAKKAAKPGGKGAIIFIDEIDAVGRQRFAGIGGGHDEREQTLNQLLVEMDGFETGTGLIIVAATNRPDVLDPALLRPGRFDRHIVIDAPDIRGREEILQVHTKKVKLNEAIELSVIAKQTPGFSGADLENLCNEAALLAARKNKPTVEMSELQEAMERVVAGPQRKSRIISKKEKEIIAYHESGHTLMALFLPKVDPLHKVSIIPRGVGALGYTMHIPERDRYISTKSELLERVCALLGGRVAEELMLGDITTGAQNDLEQATKIARKMIAELGMSDVLGNVALARKEGPVFLGKDLVDHKEYSEETARTIDREVKSLIDGAYSKVKGILTEHKDKLESLARALLEKEVLDSDEVKQIIGFTDPEVKQNNETFSSPNQQS